MQRLIWGLVIAAALVGAFLLWRYAAPPAVDAGLETTATEEAGADRIPAGSVAPAQHRTGDAATSPSAPDTVAPAAAGASGRSGDDTAAVASPPAADTPSVSSGPQPLRQEDELKLAKAEAYLSSESGTWRDLLDLAANEEQDAEARRLEGMIAQSILRHGGHVTLLRLTPPHCTRSVCLIRGVAGASTDDVRANWQDLTGKIMNEPWFGESFDDMRASVSIDGGEVVYVTLFVRCEPGTCRLGRR